jgi:hypothetical protein
VSKRLRARTAAGFQRGEIPTAVCCDESDSRGAAKIDAAQVFRPVLSENEIWVEELGQGEFPLPVRGKSTLSPNFEVYSDMT